MKKILSALSFILLCCSLGHSFDSAKVAEGKAIYDIQCASCHGTSGKGDGPAGAILKAKNFHEAGYKQGDSLEDLAKTIGSGIPGTAMVGFSHISADKRLSIATYIKHLVESGRKKSASNVEEKVSPRLGLEPAKFGLDPAKVAEGKAIYDIQCASCHGTSGKGDGPAGAILKAKNFHEAGYKQGDSLEDLAKTIGSGIPGTAMVGFSHISADKRLSVATYIKHLVESKKSGPVAGSGGLDLSLVPLGKSIYDVQCASCHGTSGKGDGPAGAVLKAKNFHEAGYKQGDSLQQITDTIGSGVPGTAMVSFIHISEDKRLAIATYIKHLVASGGNPTATSGAEPASSLPDNKVSISYAMKLVTEEPVLSRAVTFKKEGLGWKVYEANCASCHGANGEGGISQKVISAAPYYRVRSEALFGHKGYWTEDKKAFEKLISGGLPGDMMPGIGTMTREESDALYSFLKSLL